MIKKLNSLNFKKTTALCLALICSVSVGSFCVSAAAEKVNSTKKTANAANMISGLLEYIKNSNESKSDSSASNTYDTSIKIYFHKEEIVKEMELDEYISGVVYAEVPESYSIEALKAQAIAARSYTLYKIKNGITHPNGADVCTDYTHCQAWNPREKDSDYPESIKKAVKETQNTIITYDGECINALYFSNSAGMTESAENVWEGSSYPYLKSVYSPGESEFPDFCQVKNFTFYEFLQSIENYSEDITCDADAGVSNIQNIKRSPSGRILSAEIGGKIFTGLQIRAMFSLRSSNIYFTQNDSGISIVALGYGHGVGMSQCGAQAMAKTGSNYIEILKHYYPGTELCQIDFNL
ncbi:MAG: stage II sporulation protein D [Ruminococcaceae bacterium]|nr:stage II sporulation protein D [Oscillospiraceae bacterium]